ncbi:DNA-binding protein [Nocardia vinacea]|uniref:DNA-binding protein n=1 Tax=Nocardia vinacea TaxID=96468 RepID=UPI00340C1A9D
MMALIKAAPQRDIEIITSALTTLEAWDPRIGARAAALWDWALSRIGIVHTDDQAISVARSLLRDTGLHGHKYAIDAVLAATALAASARGHHVTVLTSNSNDLERLLANSNVRVELV